MSARPPRVGALSIVESARVTGGLRFVELSCYEALSLAATAADGDDAPLAVFLAAAGLAHAWRAEQLAGLLPLSVGLPGAAELTRAPSPAAAEALSLLAAAAPAELAAVALGALYPALAAAYELRSARAAPAADGPLLRVWRRVSADLAAVSGEGTSVLATDRAGALAARLDALLEGGRALLRGWTEEDGA